MHTVVKSSRTNKTATPFPVQPQMKTAFGEPRNFFDNQLVYLVVSQRAHGLSVGVNMNPDQGCNFNCIYCEVERARPTRDKRVNTRLMSEELRRTLTWIHEGRIHELAYYRTLPQDLLEFQEVALSGNGEPTLCPNFAEVVQAVVHLRATGQFSFFKMVLITNGTGLHLPLVQHGLSWFTARDEIWVKLDAGTQEAMDRVNRANYPLGRILANLLLLGRQRPIVIQSLFPLLNDQEPTPEEIEQYVERLEELQSGGAKISLVQIYSAHRPTALPDCRHLSLQCLSRIAHRVRESTGLEAEVF